MMLCASCQQTSDTRIQCSEGLYHCPRCYESHICPATELPRWPHQISAPVDVYAAIDRGCMEVCLTSPTGGGKTTIMTDITREAVEKRNWRVGLFTNRKILTGQNTETLESFGIDHGVIAAGYPMDLLKRVQLMSVQTLRSRVFQQQRFDVPYFDLCLFDECHRRDYDPVIAILRERKRPYIGVTATPIDIGDIYQTLVVAGTNSELRKCGALVPCDVFSPSEPDMKGVKMVKGEYIHAGMVKRVMQCIVFGDVFKHWQTLNPFGTPTLVFAPGVPESKWFCEQFAARGVQAAHIDHNTKDNEREDIIEGSREGRIRVICSYGVLREGFNAPWIQCGILIQVCGALKNYLQTVGRLLRAYEGKDKALLIDHSGVWHRHGSPNVDREWALTMTEKKLAKERKQRLQKGEEAEPIRCPKCGGIRKAGPECPFCHHQHTKSVRMVVMETGELKRMVGSVVKPKKEVDTDTKIWTGCLYACARSGRTVRQAAGIFRQKTGHWLPDSVQPQPPTGSLDWDRRCSEVFPWLLKRKGA